MRLHYIQIKDGKRQVLWPVLAVYVAAVYAAIIAAAEGFWYVFAGGFSPLVGGYALVAATLTLIRLVGAAFALSVAQVETHLHST